MLSLLLAALLFQTVVVPDAPPSDEDIAAAMSDNSDIQSKFAFYVGEKYEYAAYDRYMIEDVERDIKVIAREKDHERYLEESDKLKEDFGKLDAFDDLLRKEWLI